MIARGIYHIGAHVGCSQGEDPDAATTFAILSSKKLARANIFAATQSRRNHHSDTAIASTNNLTAFTARPTASSSIAAHAVPMMTAFRKLVCITFSNSACNGPGWSPYTWNAATRSLGTRGKKDRASIQSSDGGVKEPPASIPDYNGVKSPALVTAHGLPGKLCPLSRSETGPSEAFPLTPEP